MSIMTHNPLARLFKAAFKSPSDIDAIPDSAKRAMERSNESRPFNINRDIHGTRPWHSYSSKKSVKN
jgi:hypothetical protein